MVPARPGVVRRSGRQAAGADVSRDGAARAEWRQAFAEPWTNRGRGASLRSILRRYVTPWSEREC